MSECCIHRLWALPLGWRGRICYCLCGTLLILRGGDWTAAA